MAVYRENIPTHKIIGFSIVDNVPVKLKQIFQEKNQGSITEDKAVSVKVFNNFEDLTSIQREWDDFIEAVGGEIFLTFDWCRIWWKYYGKNRKLRVFVFRSNNKLVGIIPLFLERIWLGPIFVRAVKIVGSDFTLAQFSFPIHNKYIKEVVQKFFESLPKDKWDILHIGPIAGQYKHYDALKSVCDELLGHSYHVYTKIKGVQTYFELASNWDVQLSSLRKNEKGNVRRNYNLIRRLGSNESIELETCFATRANLTEFFDEFVGMHETYWNTLGKLGHFKDWPYAEEFHRELSLTHLQLGRLRLLKVSLGSNCLGYQYHYKFGDKYLHYLDSRAELPLLKGVSWGRITFCEQVKKAIGEQVMFIDSMRGKYEHKLRLGGRLSKIRSIYVTPRNTLVWCRVRFFGICARLLNLCYYKIWYSRLITKLPLRCRPLWKMWLRTNGLS